MNITFDLETLSRNENAPIVQLAAVKFKDDGEIVDVFDRKISFKSLERYGFEIEYDTVLWWFQQRGEIIKTVMYDDGSRVDIRKALLDFQKWIGSTGEHIYWSHSTFDPPKLYNAIKKVGLQPFIPYRLFLDIRTLVALSGVFKEDITRTTAEHDAMGDCLFQASHISKMIQKVGLDTTMYFKAPKSKEV